MGNKIRVRQIKTHPRYFISTEGELYSTYRNKWSTGRMSKNEYRQVILKPDMRTCIMHRLVMEVFVGKSDKDVWHINGDKSDNRLCNLEYITRSETTKRLIKKKGTPIYFPEWNIA